MSFDDDHCSLVAEFLANGEIVPFLGAGANLCDRPEEAAWELGRFAPSGGELAQTLATSSRYPDPHLDLLRVSQYVDAILGEGQLYRYLHDVFDANYPPTSVHRLFARLPAGIARARATPAAPPDDELRRPDRARVRGCGRADRHRLVRGEARARSRAASSIVFPRATSCRSSVRTSTPPWISKHARSILKLHGAIDRSNVKADSYVITEDSYIDYLVGGDVGAQIPFSLLERMADSHFLFLGYSMHDWNLRVILNRDLGGASSST